MDDGVAPISPRIASQPVQTDAQWEAFCSGPRLETVLFLSAAGPCSITELAHQMGTAPDGLYHHIRKLQRAGIVREVGSRRVGRQTEHLYDLVAEHHAFDLDPKSGRNLDRFRTLLRTILHRAERVTDRAFEAGTIDPHARPKPFEFRADATWLTDAELARVGALMSELKDIFAAGRARRTGRLFSLALFFTPLVRSRPSPKRRPRQAAAKNPTQPPKGHNPTPSAPSEDR